MATVYDEAVRLLARRPLTRHELHARLAARGHAEEEVEEALARLGESYGLSDASFARAWIAARAKARGRDRVIAELHARGISEETAEAAWRDAIDEGAVDPERQLDLAVRRRLGPPPGRASAARLARVYNALLSEGFEREPVEAALIPYGFERIES